LFDGPPVSFKQKATRFRATQSLLDIAERHHLRASDFHQHFLIPLPSNPLQLRAASKRNQYGQKISGKLLRYEETARTQKLQDQVKRLNEFLDGFDLKGGVHRGYIRVFNDGDVPAFSWNMGGRLYSYGEFNYQQMDRQERLRMTIAGASVCEIDIRASYLTIFHARFGQQLDAARDPYDVPGLGPEARGVVKMWITTSFGNNAPITRWPRDLVEKYREDTGANLGERYSASKIGEKVMRAFPLLARLCDDKADHECGWAQLMYLESEAMLA
jgi:hypothetical protein